MAKKEFTVRFDHARLKWIEKEAVRLGCSRAAIINMAVVEAMEKKRRKKCLVNSKGTTNSPA